MISKNIKPTSLTFVGRGQSQSVVGQDMNLFPFDAFTFDDVNTVENPVLTMKAPWSLEVNSIVSDRLTIFSQYLERVMREQEENQEESEWQNSQITIGQGEIDLRVTATSDLTDTMSEAYINLSAGQATSEIKISADFVDIKGDVAITGDVNLSDALTVDAATGDVNITGKLTAGSITVNDKVVVEADGSLTCIDLIAESGTFKGDLDVESADELKRVHVEDGTIEFSTRTVSTNPWSVIGTLSGGYDSGQAVLFAPQDFRIGDMTLGRGKANISTNTAMGVSALDSITSGTLCTGIGFRSLLNNTSGIGNIGIGYDSLRSNTTASGNVAIGQSALQAVTTNGSNVAVGFSALYTNTNDNNTAIGTSALRLNSSGTENSAIGGEALENCTTGSANTALGYRALEDLITYSVATGVGAGAEVTGSSQVQLGSSSTTTYAYGAVQNRSDRRDKTSIRPNTKGLEFVLALSPVEFKWDYREDYKWGNKDGSKKRSRYHSGFIAQDVKKTMDKLGVDFGGYQDHSLAGGKDVLSLGYEEFISPIVKAIQEQNETIEENKKEISTLGKSLEIMNEKINSLKKKEK